MPVVTVSRQLGSAGDLVAALAADILGYDLVDKNLITEVAREANVPESEVEKYDEQTENPVKRFLRSLITPSRSVPVPPAMLWGLEFPYEVSAALLAEDAALGEERHLLDHREYLKFLQATVQRLSKRDNVVIVGRGGQAILGDDPNVLHIRTVAPQDARIQMVVKRRGLSREEARDTIRKGNKRRAAYLKDNYGIDWNDVTLYHIILNTGRTSQDAAARLIAEMVQAHSQRPETASSGE